MVLEGVLENIQSNGLIAQMKKMSHWSQPLAKVPESGPQTPKLDRLFLLNSRAFGARGWVPSTWPLLATPSVAWG